MGHDHFNPSTLPFLPHRQAISSYQLGIRIEKMRTLVDRSKEAPSWSKNWWWHGVAQKPGRSLDTLTSKQPFNSCLNGNSTADHWIFCVSGFQTRWQGPKLHFDTKSHWYQATERLTKDSAILSRTFRRQARAAMKTPVVSEVKSGTMFWYVFFMGYVILGCLKMDTHAPHSHLFLEFSEGSWQESRIIIKITWFLDSCKLELRSMVCEHQFFPWKWQFGWMIESSVLFWHFFSGVL